MEVPVVSVEDVPHSYFKSFDYYDEIWDQIEKSPRGGIAACQLHGIGRQARDQMPAIDAYQGLVLRLLRDGSVITPQLFWDGLSYDGALTGPDQPAVTSGSSQLPLFLDPSN
jgi:hypothetical protein